MKKSLLLSAAIVAAGSAFAFQNVKPLLKSSDMLSVGPKAPAVSTVSAGSTRASGAIDFTYAQDLYGALALNGTTAGKTRVYMMFEMTPEDIQTYAGNKVTGFTVISPAGQNGAANTISEGRFFYSTTGESEDYTQTFTFSKSAYASNVITLDTPYTITGEEETLCFGYSLLAPSGTLYYIPVDGEPNNNPETCWLNSSNDDSFPVANWMSAAADYGALYMTIKIEGDNLPENYAVVSAVDTPMYLPVNGDGVDVQFMIRNAAANPISSVEVTVSMTDSPDLVQTIDFAPLEYNGTAVLTVNGVKAAKEGFGTFGIAITKVNGEARNGNAYEAFVPAYDNGYDTRIVAEDATGTWCGWCPGGIEALEYLKEACPDRAIAIGVHNGDAMAIDSYQDYIEAYVGGFPNVMYNRSISQTPTETYDNVCAYIDDIIDFFDFPAYANVELEGITNVSKTAAAVTAKTTFLFDTNVPHYLSFVIVEDGVGPYSQSNYFSSYGVKMNGWEKKGSKVSTKFNDVARYYAEFPGIENSLPANIEGGVVNEYSIELPINKVKNNDYRAIALLTNATNGRIVNACQIDLSKDVTGVDSVGAENAVTVSGGIGEVLVSGAASYEIYSLSGSKVANKNLPAGLYIVVADGQTSKVIVK